MRRLLRTAAPPLLAALLFSSIVTSHTRVSTRLSWDADVQRIVAARCAACHAPERSGVDLIPDLSSYAAARPWARAMREAMLGGHGYSAGNGGALTPFERELLVQWIDGGAPETVKPPAAPGPPATTYVRIASSDPLASLDAHQTKRGGTREIVPGLGLALRTGSQILVFERAAGAGERIIALGTVVPSVAAHLASLPSSVARTRVSDSAFIIGSGASPRLEVAVIPLEGPDRFWCPMHPDVRSPGAGACARCAMPLVEMPPLSLDDFALEVVKTEPLEHHRVRLTLRVTRGSDRVPVTSFVTLHERPFHLFLIDANGRFEHLHPEIVGTDLVAISLLPRSRARWIVGDFLPVDALPQLRMTRLAAEPIRLEPIGDPVPPTVAMVLAEQERKAGSVSRLEFAVTDRATGATPADLEPYLGAAGHLFVIDEARQDALHAHPVDLAQPSLTSPRFDVRFARAGRYDMWLQVQRAGRVETVRFTVDVSK